MFVQMINESRDGTFGDKHYWINFANDGEQTIFNEALAGLITPEIQAKIDEAREGFIAGTLDLGDLDSVAIESQ
jgi:hypothetical protein